MRSLPQHPKLVQVRQVLPALGCPAYVVGGFVRDWVLSLQPDDFDVVVEGENGGPRLARALAAAFGGRVTVHAPFATATWFDETGTPTDCITARTEQYAAPATLPIVTTPAPLAADLARRDFTLNTLALRLDGEHFGDLIDPFAGQQDLAAGCVRVLHDQSFIDDPTRLLRAVRYEQRLGFHIVPETLALFPSGLATLPALSGDRLRHELEIIFQEPRAPQMLARLDALGILRAAHPVLRWRPTETQCIADIEHWPWEAWGVARTDVWNDVWLGLLHDPSHVTPFQAALTRLNVKKSTHTAICNGLTVQLPPTPRPSQVVAICEGHPLAAIVLAYARHPEWRNLFDRFLHEWRHLQLTVTGADLARLGLPPGPAYKRLLWELRAARLDGTVAADDEAAWLAQAVAKEKDTQI